MKPNVSIFHVSLDAWAHGHPHGGQPSAVVLLPNLGEGHARSLQRRIHASHDVNNLRLNKVRVAKTLDTTRTLDAQYRGMCANAALSAGVSSSAYPYQRVCAAESAYAYQRKSRTTTSECDLKL